MAHESFLAVGRRRGRGRKDFQGKQFGAENRLWLAGHSSLPQRAGGENCFSVAALGQTTNRQYLLCVSLLKILCLEKKKNHPKAAQ